MNNSQLTPMTVDAFRLALKEKGLKATAQRVAVHQAMMALGHASADQVSAWIKAESRVSISIASVYNILNQMAEMGIYAFRFSPDNRMYFDVNASRHVHLYDMKEGAFIDVCDDELLEMVASHVRHKRFKGFKVDDVDIQIICHPTNRKQTQR